MAGFVSMLGSKGFGWAFISQSSNIRLIRFVEGQNIYIWINIHYQKYSSSMILWRKTCRILELPPAAGGFGHTWGGQIVQNLFAWWHHVWSNRGCHSSYMLIKSVSISTSICDSENWELEPMITCFSFVGGFKKMVLDLGFRIVTLMLQTPIW